MAPTEKPDQHARKSEDFEKIREDLSRLSEIVGHLCGMSSVDSVLQQGLHDIKEQLAPLRDLAPQRTPLKKDANDRLRNIRESLIHPAWDGVEYLVPTQPKGQTALTTSSGLPFAAQRSVS